MPPAQHRKASLNLTAPVPGSVTAPAARVVQSQSTTTTTAPEYMEAIHILNESTMIQACDLVLSERDYQEGNGDDNDDDEPSDQDKLLELFSKCKSALKVISKHQQQQQATLSSLSIGGNSSMLMPGTPLSLAPPLSRGTTTTVPRVNTGGVTKQLKQKTSSKQGLVPMRRTVKRPLERDRSDGGPDSSLREDAGGGGDTLTTTSSSSPHQQSSNSHKKSKVSPTASKTILAPPPGALNFLAKLNKDPNIVVPVPVPVVVVEALVPVPSKEAKASPTERRKNPGRVNRRASA
jgi:hypothetical protein